MWYQYARAPTRKSTGHTTVYSTFFLARHILGEYAFVIMSNNNRLDQLAEASLLTDTLHRIQQDLQSLCEDVNQLKGSQSTLHLPWSGDERASETITPQSGIQEPTERILGTSWAEEMDILDPILTEEPSDAARIVEVTLCTEACIKAGFQSMTNATLRCLHSKHILPKAPMTIAPCLDKVYADSCSKNTKQSDRVLAHIQALTLDAMGP